MDAECGVDFRTLYGRSTIFDGHGAAVSGAIEREFRGGGIAAWLHPDDVGPARLGMGSIDVCEEAHLEERQYRFFAVYRLQLSFALNYCTGVRVTAPPVTVRHGHRRYPSREESAWVWGVEVNNVKRRMEGSDRRREMNTPCRRDYWQRFQEKRGQLSRFVRDGVAGPERSAEGG